MRLVIGPDRPCVDELAALAGIHSGGGLSVAVAWARDDGVGALLDALAERIVDLRVLVGLNERGTTVEALLRLLPATTELHVFFKHPRQTFHPKIYCFRDPSGATTRASLMVGSSNLTYGGLLSNIEASLAATYSGNQATSVLDQFDLAWDGWVGSPWAHRIGDVSAVERLYRGGYLSLEQTLRRDRRRARTEGAEPLLPTAPPPRRLLRRFPPVTIPFEVQQEPADVPDASDPVGLAPLPGRFFVRTLTPNDVAKLHGRQSGTFEPDLGETARNEFPAFWGWPDKYAQVVRQLSRLEWGAKGRLVTSLTPASGLPIDVVLWFREARPGHAAEHRMRLGPIGDVRQVIPAAFDATSLLVVERASADSSDFVVRLIVNGDPGYDDYRAYLAHDRQQHSYGYGP